MRKEPEALGWMNGVKMKTKMKPIVVELGAKHFCAHCEIKFYDFGRPNVVCPRCNRPEERKSDTETVHGLGKAARKGRLRRPRLIPQNSIDDLEAPVSEPRDEEDEESYESEDVLKYLEEDLSFAM